MKKNKKKIWKLLIQGFVYLAMLGVFAGFVVFLNRSAQTETEDAMDWEPEAAQGIPEGWELAAENQAFELYFEPSAVQFMVKDKASGAQWRSNPENASEDPIAFGQNKMRVQSLLEISYVDDQSNFYTANSFADSVQADTYTYEYGDNGIYVNLQFAKQGFEIPCFFGIQEDRFVARVFSDQIKQHGSLQVASIVFLPYFGAGSLEEEGYMLVPDGSGALIYFNNQKQSYQTYSQKVYGRNLALNLQNSTLVTQNAVMPVFGIKKGSDALLAVITKGEYQAEIKAEVARKLTANNAVYTNILYIQSESNTLLSGSNNEESVIMLSPQHNQFPYYEVAYFFLQENAGYNEMGSRYRRYLIEEKGMRQEASVEQESMNLTFLGGVEVNKTFLGVPYRAVKALTTFEELRDTALELQQKNGNVFQISMRYLENGGSMSKIPVSLTYEGALGGKKGYKKMADALEAAGISFYPVYDTVTIRKFGNGYRDYQGVRNVSKSASRQYDYLLTSGDKDTTKSPFYLVSPQYEEKIMSSLLASAEKQGVGSLGLAGISDHIYADYRTDSISDNETGAYWERALEVASSSAERLLLEGAYAYAFPYADVITEAPVYTSQFDVEDEAVPFYEMVVGGSAALYSTPVNESGNTREMLLKTVEYGVSPTFLLMTARRDALQDTDYQQYYSLCWGDWEQEIGEILEELKVLDGVFGQRIISHRKLGDGIYATSFEGGADVYVNYGQEDVTVEGVTIPAQGFVRKGDQ
ncbi:MAG: hypothetical protein K2O06_13985 [Acetatifactor sp.]|nr:hypothetical protein [Acetatifactor sp.]